jgi:FtsZ-binding cell division protein ZapB
MSAEDKSPSVAELQALVESSSERIKSLEDLIDVVRKQNVLLQELNHFLEESRTKLRVRNDDLESENQGWLEIYQKHLFAIDALEAEISRLESRTSSSQE